MQRILALLTSLIVFGKIEGGESESFHEYEILDKLFTECETPTLTVFQTRSYLESLKNFYINRPRKFLSEVETSRYLKLAVLTERASCFDEEIYAHIELAQNFAKGRCNLVEFLVYHKQLYSERCNKDLANAYLAIIENISTTTVMELSQLAASVKSVSRWQQNTKKPFYSQEALIQGIYNYLVEIAAGVKIADKPDKCRIKIQNFSKLYKSKIANLCEQVGDEFKRMSKTLLDSVAGGTRVFNSIDLLIRSWLFSGSICLDILDKHKQVEIETYQLYKDNKPESILHYLCYFQ